MGDTTNSYQIKTLGYGKTKKDQKQIILMTSQVKSKRGRPKQLEVKIKEIMGVSVLAPFFMAKGLALASRSITAMSDDMLIKMFNGIYAAKDIRAYYKTLAKELNDGS